MCGALGARSAQAERLVLDATRAARRDRVLADERSQHLALARPRCLRGTERIERARRLRQPREQRRLRPRQAARRAPEVAATGRFDAVEAVPEIDRVQVHREDRRLRIVPLELEREADRVELAAEAAALAVEHLRQL